MKNARKGILQFFFENNNPNPIRKQDYRMATILTITLPIFNTQINGQCYWRTGHPGICVKNDCSQENDWMNRIM